MAYWRRSWLWHHDDWRNDVKNFTRLGLSVFDYVEYPSLIRGGHNAYYVRGASEQIFPKRNQ